MTATLALHRIHLPAGPLLEEVDRIPRKPPGKRLTKAVSRARTRGVVTASAADVIAIKLCGKTLDEIYGPNWDDPERRA